MLIGRKSGRKRRRGITLLECVIALMILPLAVAGIAFAVTAGQQQAMESLRRERGATLAEAMLDEILSKPYADSQGVATPGPDAGETSRSLYDNMDDYDGFTEAAGTVKNASGVLYGTQYQTFKRTVACTYTTQTFLGTSVSGLLITVTVSDAKGSVITLNRFVADPG